MRFLFKTAALVSFAALPVATSANAADYGYHGYAPHYAHYGYSGAPAHHGYYGAAASPHVIVFDPQVYPAAYPYPASYSYAATNPYPAAHPYPVVAYAPPPRIVAYRRTPSRLNCLVGRPVLDKDVFSGFGIFNACDGEWVR
jgi:hypothetical protein